MDFVPGAKQHRLDQIWCEEFLHNHDRVMNRAVRKAIADPQSSKFFSPDGFMIGDGEVWFQKSSAGMYKVIAINLGAVPAGNTAPPNA